ncbi:MAG: ABC transporter ATP-binding protein [Hyphomicrobiales bacterium]
MRPADPAVAARGESGVGIVVDGVAKSFARTAVLHGIDLAVRAGEFLCLLGPSGCGKTTLLRCLAGLERPDAGSIAIGDRPVVDIEAGLFVPPERRRLGMVFQHYALWPHMTVEQNIAYPLRKQGVPPAARAERIRQIMKVVNLPAVLEKRPAQLSGGQQQRVALARALVYEPPVLLLDEPLSNLDATLRRQLRRELRQLHERLGTTTVLVTHDQEEAAALADTIAVMYQGRVAQFGTAAEVLAHPRTRFVAEFVGFDNFIPGCVVDAGHERAVIAIGPAAKVELKADASYATTGDHIVIAARSDSLRLSCAEATGPDGASPRGVVRRVTKAGLGVELEVMVGDHVILVHESGEATRFEPGADVHIDFATSGAVIVADDPEGPVQAP